MRIITHPFMLLTLAALFWAGNFVLGRALKNSIPPISLAFWRWMLALVILLPFSVSHMRSQWLQLLKNRYLLAVYGLLGVSCFNTFVYIGLHTTTATNALLLNAIIPILIVLFSRMFGATPVTYRQLFGIVISLTGVLTIICRANPEILMTLQVNKGDIWILMAVICWSLYTFLLRKRPAELHALSFLTAIIAIGLIPLSVLYFWELGQGERFMLDFANLASIFYVGLFPSVLAFIFWNQAVREVGPDKSGLFLYLMPVFGTILSSVFLGESIHTFHLIGMVLIFAGIHLTTRKSLTGRI